MARNRYDDDDLYVEDDDEGARNPLRDVVKKLEKRLADLEKDLQSKDEALQKYVVKERQETVAEVLKAKGVPPKAARFALADLGENATPEAVEAWLQENGDLFGYQAKQEDEGPDPDTLRAHTRIADLETGAIRPEALTPLEAKLMDPTLKREQLEALIASGGQL